MKKSIKIDEGYYLNALGILKDNDVDTEQLNSTNHIFVVDVSGSMYYDLPLIRKQLKNKLSNIMRDGDTITIIWFSGNGQSGVLKEEVEVKSLQDLTNLHDAIDRWLQPVGLTAFLKPLELTKEVIERIKGNRPNTSFSLIFLTDGYNNDCPWHEVISTLNSMKMDLNAATFVEYGFYADTQRLTQMASIIGGEKIATSDFDNFEPVFNEKISSGVLSSNQKQIIEITDSYLYDFAFTVNNDGAVLLYNIEDSKILVGDDIKIVYFFSKDQIAESVGIDNNNRTGIDTALYAAIYVLSDKLMNFEAEKIFYALGDNYYYKELLNAFGKQKLNDFKFAIKECVKNTNSRFPEGRNSIKPVADDTYCLMDLVSDLVNMDNVLFYPSHSDFKYNRIGKKRVVKSSELSDKDKQRLAEAKNVEEANQILNELKETNVDLEFHYANPDKGYPIKDLVWNEERANLSVRIKIDGYVKLPDNKYDLIKIDTYKYRTYTLIKDGIINIDKLPVNWTQELDDLLVEKGVSFSRSTEYDSEVNGGSYSRSIIIDLKSLPIINRKMVKNIYAGELAKYEWELKKLQGDNKVYNYYRKELFPKTSESFIDKYGKDCADWLKSIGITDYNGFNPKTDAGEVNDFYMSVILKTKIKGLSSLPKVDIVWKKIQEGKKLKLNEYVMSNALIKYNKQLESDIYKSLSKEQQREMLKTYLINKSNELNKLKRNLMQQIAQIKFSLILSKKWFKEFDSFDDNTLILKSDNQDVTFTFDLSEKEVKI